MWSRPRGVGRGRNTPASMRTGNKRFLIWMYGLVFIGSVGLGQAQSAIGQSSSATVSKATNSAANSPKIPANNNADLVRDQRAGSDAAATTPQNNGAINARPNGRALMEEKFLARAERAFREGRLTEPQHDNAYDSFQSVLMVNPQNKQARAGLQAILINQVELMRGLLNRGDYSNAETLMKQIQSYYPSNGMLAELKKELAAVRVKEEKQMLATSTVDNSIAEYKLPTNALNRKSETVAAYLGRIAQRIKENDESIIIHARNDAEGRWIYKQLKDGVPGYRVRGDIRLGGSAKIVVLPPLH